MAGAFRSNPRLLGYDLFNEPYPGSQDPTCMQPIGCPAFDRLSLEPLESKLAAAVRAQDPSTIAFFEPHLYFDFGVASWLDRPPAAAGPAGFAFHDYCLAPIFAGQPDHESSSPGYPTCPYEDEHVMENGEAAAAAMNAPVLFDEFGDTQDVTDIERVVQLADSHLMSWLYWSYKDWVDAPGGAGSGPLFDDSNDNATLRTAKLAVLSEPYPQATAGTPLAYRYDATSDTFTDRYAADAAVKAPTLIYVPPLHYPNGYAVSVTGARVVSKPGSNRLTLDNEPGARQVSVTIRPAG
jgi:endoglycosylceramidase